MTVSIAGWMTLLAAAFTAGWIDAMIGGGGLILIPAIMATVGGISPVTALATNKFAACMGTTSAAYTLTRRVKVSRRRLRRFVPIALVGSATGALAAGALSSDVLRPLVIGLLLVSGIFIVCNPRFGQATIIRSVSPRRARLMLVYIALIAAYDGFFGPGTGMFLIMAFTAVMGYTFVQSATMTKVVNASTNIGALVVFILHGHLWFTLGIVLAGANIAGAILGARTVLAGGTRLIRIALLTLVVVMVIYLFLRG